ARRLDFRLIRLLLRGAKAAVCHPLLVLTTRDDKVVIFAVAPPRPRWHVTNFDELPIGHVGWRHSQVIAHGRQYIQPSTVVQDLFGTLISKDVLQSVCAN